jgi:heptosyltransferase-2
MAPLSATPDQPRRILVVLPSWVGDVVMATPALRAIRQLYPASRITWLLKDYVQPVIDAAPWCDRMIRLRSPRSAPPAAPRSSRRRRTSLALSNRLRAHRFDLAILLPNSFRSAAIAALANIPRRLGYDRDSRGLLLTDPLVPLRDRTGKFTPVPIIDYYLGLPRYLGAASPSRQMELFTRPTDDARAAALLAELSIKPHQPLVMLNPGAANMGDAKLWPADRFAAVADDLIDRCNAAVLVNGSPRERPILDALHSAARHPLIDLPSRGSDLKLLKSLVARCSLMITNDTGARHIAAAMNTPVLALFGPTDPEWTRLDIPHEQILRAHDGQMTSLAVPRVIQAARDMLKTHLSAT